MGEYITQVGMDVHARSAACSAIDTESGEVWERSFSGPGYAAELIEWAKGLPQPAHLAYESGCTGFDLCRRIRAEGLACDVAATSSLARSPEQRARKNDRADAAALRGDMCNPSSGVSWCWVPTAEQEGVRDLVRELLAERREVGRRKQRVLSLLLRHGWAWDEKGPGGRRRATWTKAHRKWVAEADLGDPLSNAARDRMLADLASLEGQAAATLRAVREVGRGEGWAPYVDAISLLSGVSRETALLAAAEFGDFSRFSRGRSVARWIGCVPSERSSGGRQRRGGVTKMGPALLRRQLVEGASTLPRRSGGTRVPAGARVSPATAAMAREANRRLKARYEALRGAGKPANAAKVACVRELACWIWAIGLQVQSELAAS